MVLPYLDWQALISSLNVLSVAVHRFMMAQAVTYSIWGQSRTLVPGKAVQLSPALAKLVIGGVIPFMKAKGMICREVSARHIYT